MGDKDTIKVDVRVDGVYLIIHNEEDKKVTRLEVLKVLEDFGIQDIDFSAVTAVFKTEEKYIDIKVSSNKKIIQEPEKIIIEVSKTKTKAYIRFEPPINNGPKATLGDMKKALILAGIRYGIVKDMLETLVEEHDHYKNYLIAEGQEPVVGVDGHLVYNFDTSRRSLKPKILDNGVADFHNLDLIELVYADQILVTAVDKIESVEGMDVYNVPLRTPQAKATPALPRGKNTMISEDGKHLIAEVSGQVILDGRRVSISPILEIKENVDHSTGDIHFNGSVIIRGTVVSGFAVSAGGNLEIYGVVEGCKIHADGGIVFYSGVQGQDRAEISAGGDITATFAERCVLFESGGDIIAENIMHSNVKCKGSLELIGKKGLLVGSRCSVGKKITAKSIGSTIATVTELEVGHNLDKLEEYRALSKEYEEVKHDYDKTSALVESLNAQNKIAPLPEKRKNLLLKCLHTKMYLRERLAKIQERINIVLPDIGNGSGVVYASEVIRSGVKVFIGGAVMYVTEDIYHCSLTNKDFEVVIGSYE